MPAGRPPKPIEVKRRTGNPGRRPLPKTSVELVRASTDPVPPSGLGQAGAAYWRMVWKTGKWLSPELDRPAVERCCRLVAECRGWEKEISRYGLMIQEPIITSAGAILGSRPIPNPAAKELRAAEKQLQSWLSLLGFEPTARARLGYAEVKTRSKLEELMERRERANK